MKCKICLMVVLLVLCFSIAQADNNIMIMVDTIRSSTYVVPVACENDVDLWGFSNGFRISATGTNTAWFVNGSAYIDTLSRGGILSSIWWAFRYVGLDTLHADTILTGTAYL